MYKHFLGGRVQNVSREIPVHQEVCVNRQKAHTQRIDLLGQPLGDLLSFFGDNRAIFRIDDIRIEFLIGKSQRIKTNAVSLLGRFDFVGKIKFIKQLLRGISQCFEQHTYRQFPAAVNADIQDVLDIKLKIKPGTTHGDNTRRIEPFA